ncbi:MAG: PIG-L family deacetylase [Planctomycetota bacterium]|nr:PIG-L family deacetylase [Planctomycetota bacterium]
MPHGLPATRALLVRGLPCLLAAALPACAGLEPASGAVEAIDLERGGYGAIDDALPRVLIVVAHPDDELIAAGLTYLHGACAGGAVDVVTITDGQGGFKYASFAEASTGIELTREEVGRAELPAIRREEQMRGLTFLGARRLIRLGQPDHRYSQDRMEVLAPDAGVWDLPGVRRHLDQLLEAGRYELVITISPTATTHGHHQAAALLAVEAAARRPHEQRPVLLCCQVEAEDSEGVGAPPDVLEDTLLARLRPGATPLVVDRNRGFGHRDRLTLKAVASVAIAQHLSQGTMLGFIGRGDLEEYWILDASPPDAAARATAFFASLARLPDLPLRSYDASAGTNAAR